LRSITFPNLPSCPLMTLEADVSSVKVLICEGSTSLLSIVLFEPSEIDSLVPPYPGMPPPTLALRSSKNLAEEPPGSFMGPGRIGELLVLLCVWMEL
jgi:hypothetical protein